MCDKISCEEMFPPEGQNLLVQNLLVQTLHSTNLKWNETSITRLWTNKIDLIMSPQPKGAPCVLNQITDSGQTWYIVMLGWFKDLIRFWWPCPNFQGHYTIKIVKMSLVCTLSPEPIDEFDQTYTETPMGYGKEVIRFWWPWPHFQGHTSTLNVKFWPQKACLHTISWTQWWILAKLYVLYHWDN